MQIESSSTPISDLESRKPPKRLEFKDFLSKGTYIDAKDSTNSWCVAKIIEIFPKEERILIRYDGWGERWNDNYSIYSKKVLPFRRSTTGYTGNAKFAFRDFVFNPLELQQNKALVQRILQQDFEQMSCFEVTQALRGKLYIYVDCLVTCEYEEVENIEERMLEVLDFIFLYIKLCARYLEKFKGLYPQYQKGLQNPDAFLSESDVALSLCLSEIADTLAFIFYGDKRCKGFYTRFYTILETLHVQFPIEATHSIVPPNLTEEDSLESKQQQQQADSSIPPIFLKMVNHFAQNGGIEALMSHLSFKTLEIEGKDPLNVPFSAIDHLLRILKLILHYLNPKLQLSIVRSLQQEISKRYSSLNDRDIKDHDREFLMKLIMDVKTLVWGCFEDESVNEMAETLELELALKYLISPYFEKRLKGILSLNEIAERVEFTEKYVKNSEFSLNISRNAVCRYLDSERLMLWVRDHDILGILLGDNIHVEILKRAHELFKFLCKRKGLLREVINQLWQACEGKHDTITRSLFEIIANLSAHMSKESLFLLYQKLKGLDLKSYNELLVTLLKEFCENVVNLAENSTRITDSSAEIDEEFIENNYFGVNLFWNVVLDESPLSTTLTEEALGIFKGLLLLPNCKPLRKFYLIKSIQQIKTSSSIPQCLSLITRILQQSFQRKAENEAQMRALLSHYDSTYDLVGLVIRDLERYSSKIRAKFADKIGKSGFFEEIFEGKHCHKNNIDLRLNLLDLFASYSLLSEQNLECLWEIFVVSPLHYSESLIYFHWLARQNDVAKGEIQITLTKPLLGFQFTQILCNPAKNNLKTLQEDGFFLFYLFFLTVNSQERNLRMNKTGKLSNVNIKALNGLNTLWEILYQNDDEKVTSRVCELLSELHLKVTNTGEFSSKKKESAEEFTNFVMNLLRDAYASAKKTMINKAIYLLIVFFEKFEGRFMRPSSQKTSHAYHFINLTVLLRPDNIQKEIRMNVYDRVGSFRRKISEEFSIPLTQLKLIHKNDSLSEDSDNDELTLREFGLGGVFFIARKPQFPEDNYHPKHLISESQDYLDLLFKLLSESDPECLNNIWDLLMKLPSNEKIKNSLLMLEKPFEELIEVKSFYKCLYCLQIIEELTFENCGKSTNLDEFFENDWHLVFINQHGLEFLVALFLDSNTANFQQHLAKKSTCILLRLIFFYQKRLSPSQLFDSDPQKLPLLCSKLLNTMLSICEYSLLREAQNLENYQLEKDTFSKSQASKVPSFFLEEADILYYCQEFLLSLINCSLELLEMVYRFEKLERILAVGLVLSDNPNLKEKFSNGLNDLFRAYSLNPGSLIRPHHFFIPIFVNHTLEVALALIDRAEMFFKLLVNTLEEIQGSWDHSEAPLGRKYQNGLVFEVDFYALLVKLIGKVRTVEDASPSKELIFLYTFNLIKVLLSFCPGKSEEIGISLGLVDELLFKCLFEVRKIGNNSHSGYKCRTFNSRDACFLLLGALAAKSVRNLEKVVDFFAPMLRESDWRTKGYSDWNITAKSDEKSITGYVGLKNLGCICYMNSLMQQLYMIPAFRSFVLDVEDRNYTSTPTEDNMLFQLKCLFLALKESEKQFYNPRYFCQAFKDWEGNPTNVFEQRDVDEFLNMFMDRLETLTKGGRHQDFLKSHFGGYLSNEFICKDCPHYSEREEPFLAVSLQVKNKKTIEESLSSFVEGELLEGQNAYLCERCDKKVTAIKRICLKKLPNHLILVLKRFEFDYDTMSKVKINDSCEFPMRLNLEKYTQYGLRKAEHGQRSNTDHNNNGNDNNDNNKNKNNESAEYEEGYFDYELKGMVIHMGIADSGHYYSIIQDREKQAEVWYEFNDTYVKYFDVRDIPNEAFGGEEKWSYYVGSMTNLKEKIKNAYLLFYDRITPIEPRKHNNEESKEPNEKAHIQTLSSEKEIKTEIETTTENPLSEFHNQIIEDNHKFHIHRNVFSQEFFQFMFSLVCDQSYSKNRDALDFPYKYSPDAEPKKWRELEISKLGLLFLLTCIIREKERKLIVKILPFMKTRLKKPKNLPLCQWFISGFSVPATLEELFLQCPVTDMRKLLTGLIKTSVAKLFKFISLSRSPLISFSHTALFLLDTLSTKPSDATEFFKLFYIMASASPALGSYLIQQDVLLRLLKVFLQAIESQIDFRKCPLKPIPLENHSESLLGGPKEATKRKMTKLDEFKQRKKEKVWLENNRTNRLYLWKAIAYLLRFYKISKEPHPLQIPGYAHEMGNFELSILLGDTETTLNMLNDAHYRVSVKATGEIFAYLGFENMKFTELALKAALKGFKERDVNSFRPYFGLVKRLVRINDSLAETRVEKIMRTFMLFMNENINYLHDAFYQQQFVLKLAGKEEYVRKYFQKNPESIAWIINWIVDTELPNLSANTLVKTNALRFNRFKVPKTAGEYRSFCHDKITRIKKLMKGELEPSSDTWDSDDDLSDQTISPGDKLDFHYHSFGAWVTVKVEKSLDELINISFVGVGGAEKTGTLWRAVDCDEFSPFLSMQETQQELSPMEIETRDSTEKNVGSGNESENEQPAMGNQGSVNSDAENQGDLLNTTNEI